MSNITISQLLKAGAHFGHQTRFWSPKMAPYIYGDRNKIHIINLERTLPMLKEATNYLSSVVAKGGKVLFVGTKRQAGKQVREHAIRCESPFVDHRWLGGMLTNYKTVKNSITRLKQLESYLDSGEAARLSKKEGLTLERERIKLDRTLFGIKNMGGLPDALFVIDVHQEYIAIAEAKKLGIPVVAVVDTNCRPESVDYIIPGNDDSTSAIKLYVAAAADAIIDARSSSRKVVVVEAGDDDYIEISDESNVEVVMSEDAEAEEQAQAVDSSTTQAKAEGESETEADVAVKQSKKKVAKKKTQKKTVTKKTTKKVTKKASKKKSARS